MISIKIIVPTLNSYLLLPRLIGSLKAQTWRNWNLIFVDGESSPDHVNWIKSSCEEDQRLTWVKQSNMSKGIFGAMNEGINKCNSEEWLLFWGSDDWATSPNVFADINESLIRIKPNTPDLVIYRGRYIDRDRGKLKRKTSFISSTNNQKMLSGNTFRKKLYFGSTPPHQATLFGPGALSKLNQYSEKFDLAADLDYFLKISISKELNIMVVDNEIVYISDAGISGIQRNKRLKEVQIAYKNSFKNSWWVPFIFRYIKKIFSLIPIAQ